MLCKLCSGDAQKIFDANNIHGRHIFSVDEKFEVYRCNKCNVVFIANVLIDSAYYGKYYPKNYYNELYGKVLQYIIEQIGNVAIRSREKQILSNLSLNDGVKAKILDVGCGSGGFLSGISDNNFEKYGIEINPEGYKICKDKGIKVYNQDIKNISFGDKFLMLLLYGM